LNLYCPAWFNDETSFEFYAAIKNKIAILASLEQKEDQPDLSKKLNEIDLFFVEKMSPGNFDADSSENAVLRADASFEILCTILESNGVANASSLTVLQFYLRLEHFKKLNQPAKPA
jgi:hypothetical protein